jgi:hypothetical protein
LTFHERERQENSKKSTLFDSSVIGEAREAMVRAVLEGKTG